MRRELAIVFRARVTWLVAALAALLVGHGFVLAIDLYSAASRSALASTLQAREMDPLAGIVRPTLGGVHLAIALLLPLLVARPLAIEKERGTYGARCLTLGSTHAVLAQKGLASLLGAMLFLVPPIVLFEVLGATGAHLDSLETLVALLGEGLHALLITAVTLAAAAWADTFAQAAALGIVASLASWAIDAADGFAALAWLGGARAWSIGARSLPFERGLLSLGSVAWLLVATLAASMLAVVGAGFDPLRKRIGRTMAVVVGSGLVLFWIARFERTYDWTEARRMSLPAPVVASLRAIPAPLSITAFLDRDDSRRRQLEADTLTKLVLARPDLTVRWPLDAVRDVAEAEHDETYGRILVRVGNDERETRSTSRRELVTLILEAGGAPLPAWEPSAYAGYPFVAANGARLVLVVVAYFLVPLAFVAVGLVLSRRRTLR